MVFPTFSSPASLKIILLVAQGILRAFFYNRFILRNENFSKMMSLSFIFVTTWRSILSEIDLVVLPLAISFIVRTSSPSARSFSRPLLLENF